MSCLCLRDLSAVFDTVDHSILITRLSPWFGIHGFVLNWFKSSRSFLVKCNDCFSSHVFVYLKVLFLVHYSSLCTPLSTLSSLSLNHHLYADDPQLFFSFYPQDLDLIIACLQNALHQISFWMTANLLTLNSSKTEFILIGLKQQLANLHDCSFNITHSARNLGFVFL